MRSLNKKLPPTHGKKHWSVGRFASLTARIKLAHGRYERNPQLQRFLTAGTLAPIKIQLIYDNFMYR